MTRTRHTWPIAVTVRGPFLTQATAAGRLGLDAVLAVDPASQRYALPGTLVRGRLRHALLELSDCGVVKPADIDDWFGRRSDDGDAPQRRRVHLSDLLGPAKVADPAARTRIRIDPLNGAAWQGMVQLVESPFAAGERVTFAGELSAVCDAAEATALHRLVELGLRWNAAFGADTGVGFGQVEAVVVGTATTAALPQSAAPPATARAELWLAVEPKEPFVVAKRRTTGNTFESAEVLPGAVLKGMIADAVRRWAGHPTADVTDVGGEFAELGRALGALTIGHAFPAADDGRRPVEPPRSLVAVGSRWADALGRPGPFLVDGRAPAFATDWKGDVPDGVRAGFGWPKLDRDMRVRTEIDAEKRKAADQQLFAYDMVVPKDRRWLARIDLSAAGDPAAVAAQLARLFKTEFRNLGKTKARAAFTLLDKVPTPFVGSAAIPEQVTLTLQTPALIGNPLTLSPTDPEGTLHTFYADYWHEVSGGSLALDRFFAGQELAGGYLTYRFRRNPDLYRPYLLTSAGSVFRLTVTDQTKADGKLAEWRTRGLPNGAWVDANVGTDWRTNPFRREEGFGEIADDLDCPGPDTLGTITEITDG